MDDSADSIVFGCCVDWLCASNNGFVHCVANFAPAHDIALGNFGCHVAPHHEGNDTAIVFAVTYS